MSQPFVVAKRFAGTLSRDVLREADCVKGALPATASASAVARNISWPRCAQNPTPTPPPRLPPPTPTPMLGPGA
jgi:hypothetical protein